MSQRDTIGPNRSLARFAGGKPDRSLFIPTRSFIDQNHLALDITYVINDNGRGPFITPEELDRIAPLAIEKHQMLKQSLGDCRDGQTVMLGWQTIPDEITIESLDRISGMADRLAGRIDRFLSLGIGGSYLGIEATIRALSHTYANQLERKDRGNRPEIYFFGQNTDPDFIRDTLDLCSGRRIGVNVISKSGTTTETAIAFRLVRELLFGDDNEAARELIVVTTDAHKGALRELAQSSGYQTLIVPDNIGGRFSVLSDVGLFGLAVAGVNVYEFTAGFRHMKSRTDGDDFWTNPALVHAAIRHLAFQKGKKVEVVATNSTALYQLARWMEQLFPESEGHKGHGMWVSPSLYSEKLHANGQMVQQGPRVLFETFLRLGEADNTVSIPADRQNLDQLNYLPEHGLTVNSINDMVIDGPAYAHFKGGVPNMTLTIPRRNAFNLGQFYFLMERSVAISGYLAGHNPFIQPGVEDYKKAVFSLAGKPGFEDEGVRMRKEIGDFSRRVI